MHFDSDKYRASLEEKREAYKGQLAGLASDREVARAAEPLADLTMIERQIRVVAKALDYVTERLAQADGALLPALNGAKKT
jgi:hypothetical protein